MIRFLWTLCLIGFISNICVGKTINHSDQLNYRLNTDIEPIDYIIDVTPHFESSTFDGICTITLKTTKTNVSTITLHKLELNIIEQKLTKKPSLVAPFPRKIENVNITSSDYDQTTHKYTLKLASPLVKDELYQLYFNYTGSSKPYSGGFYQSSYEEGNAKKWFAVTRFQPSAARKMYPCFDEPQLKATFSMIVNRPAHFKPSISNTPMVSSHRTSSNLVREYFDKTPIMSTYLVAVLISEFECRENAMKNFSVCAEPLKYNQTEYSFDVGQKMLKTFDELFDYKYNTHITKLTMAAVSNYAGMENWGLIIGGPLLFDPTSSTFASKKGVANLIAHEQAHLWFGDIVTCDWWSDLWLNEGFATYFEFYGLAMIEKDWGLDTQFLLTKVHLALEGDTLDGSVPLSRKADTPGDIGGMFSQLTYVKGATMIRMFNYTLGHDKFVAGLRNYFKQNALKTAVPDTLYAAFQTAVKNEFNVSEVLDGWITQTGYPVITVQVSSDRKQIEVRQNRYLRNETIHHDETQWNVPLNWASNIENSDFSHSKPMTILKNSSLKINLNKPIDWIVFNVQQSGYYRVNYDDKTWSSITKILHKSHSTIHVTNRAELINDVFELARFSYTNYKNAINLVDYLQNEIDYAPWGVAFKHFERLLPRFKPNDLFIFERFGSKLLTEVYKHVGFHQKAAHDILDQYNRLNVIEYACKFGVEQCTADARREYDLFRKGNYSIPVDLAPSVLCSVVEHGSESDWDSVWNIITSDALGQETWKSVRALGCTKQPSIIKKYLNLIVANKIRYTTDAFETTYFHRQHIHLVLDFIYANHKEIGSKVSIDFILTKLLRNVSTSEEINRVERFMQENGLDSSGLLRDLEAAKSELRWANKYVPVIMEAMKQNS